MKPKLGTLIQFSCDANSTIDDDIGADKMNLFTENLLNHLGRKNVDVRYVVRDVVNAVDKESNRRQQPLTMDELPEDQEIFLNRNESG